MFIVFILRYALYIDLISYLCRIEYAFFEIMQNKIEYRTWLVSKSLPI